MDHADPTVVATALVEAWRLPTPLTVDRPFSAGVTSDVFHVRASDGSRYAAKLIYDRPSVVEPGLRAAEIVQDRTGVSTGRPLRAIDGSLTVLTDTVRGQRHPLALLTWVEGTPLVVADRTASCGHLLAQVQHALSHEPLTAPDTLLGYLRDDPIDFVGSDSIGPVVREVVDEVLSSHELVWGTCYGDGPELLAVGDGLALIDWGALTRAPLLWDVYQWAVQAGPTADEFVEAYRRGGGPAAGQVDRLPLMGRLAAAHQLRFRAFRIAHRSHYDETAGADRAALVDAALQLDLNPDAVLAACRAGDH